MIKLTKLQERTLLNINRWVNGSYTHSKAVKTNKQLVDLGLAFFDEYGTICLTSSGRERARYSQNEKDFYNENN